MGDAKTISISSESKKDIIDGIQRLGEFMKDITPENCRRYYRDMRYRRALEGILLAIIEKESEAPDPRYGEIAVRPLLHKWELVKFDKLENIHIEACEKCGGSRRKTEKLVGGWSYHWPNPPSEFCSDELICVG